jgi:hypothetical protein
MGRLWSKLWSGNGSVAERLWWVNLGGWTESSGGEDDGVGGPLENWVMKEKTLLRPIVNEFVGCFSPVLYCNYWEYAR